MPRVLVLVVGGLAVLCGTVVLGDPGDTSPRRTRTTSVTVTPAAAVPRAAPSDQEPPPSVGEQPEPSPRWVARTSARAGIPEAAVRAYARAALRADPACGLGWTTLAGIGYVESAHGTVGERSLGAHGRPSSPILGPALDGRGPVAAIRSTPESARWHGDPTWEHALGPLQFLWSSWDSWRADGDGDGVADPGDVDDAALAAAGYLCADARDLRTGPGWVAAVLSYNHDAGYAVAVHAAATTYGQRVG